MPYNWTVAFVILFLVQVRKRIRKRKRRGTKRKRADDLSDFGDWVPLCHGTLACAGVASKNLEKMRALSKLYEIHKDSRVVRKKATQKTMKRSAAGTYQLYYAKGKQWPIAPHRLWLLTVRPLADPDAWKVRRGLEGALRWVRRVSKQRRNPKTCGGKCGKVGCDKVYGVQYNLDFHLGKTKTKCPFCATVFTTRASMILHARKQHPEHFAPDGSCVAHGINAKGTKRIHFPPALAKLAAPEDRERVLDLFQGGGYAFLVKKLGFNIGDDLLHAQRTAARDRAQQTYLEACHAAGNAGNQLRHALAQDVAERIIRGKLWKPGAMEAGGGRLPKGFVLETHGGLFAPSLDRVDNSKDHFLVGQGTFVNIVLLSAGMNTHANIVADGYQENTAAKVKEEMERSVAPAEKAAVKAREANKYERVDGAQVPNALYASCNSTSIRKKTASTTTPPAAPPSGPSTPYTCTCSPCCATRARCAPSAASCSAA